MQQLAASIFDQTQTYLVRVCALLSFAAVGMPVYAQEASSSLVINQERLGRIDHVLQGYIEQEEIAGAVGLVLRDGEVIYQNAVGWADRENNRPMAMNTIFRIASQTKAITSTAVLMLVEQGIVNLNAPISHWMPTFAHTSVALPADSGVTIVPAQRSITVKDLLTHTAGISYGRESIIAKAYTEQELGYEGEAYGWYTAHKEEPICKTMDRLGDLPFVAQPGARWVYGYSTDILGCIVERASGQPLDAFIQDKLTAPLGMADTYFYLPAEKADRLATVYTRNEKGGIERSPEGPRGQGDYLEGPQTSFAGGAGLLSTAYDYARFLEMIRNHGTLADRHYLAPHTVALMTSNQVGPLHSANGLGFGLGFQTTDRPGANEFASVGAFGWSGAYGTVYEIDPHERLVIVLMIQVLPYYGNGIREAFKAAVYHALVPPEKKVSR